MINAKVCAEILDGSLTAYNDFATGFYKSYHITIDYKKPFFIVYIHATHDNDAGKAMFESFLKQHKDSTAYLTKAEAKEHTIKLHIIRPNKKKLLPSILDNAIKPIVTQLLGCKYVTGCINCGRNDVDLNCYSISGYHHYLCEECITEIEEGFKTKQKDLNSQPVNAVPGTIGAFMFSLVGIILWSILQSNGLYGWLSGVVIIFCAFKGYELFGQRLDKRGFITALVISGIMIILSNHLAWAWAYFDASRAQKYTTAQLLTPSKLITLMGSAYKYIESLILGFAVSFTLGFKMIKSKYRTSTGGYNIHKVE